MLPARCWRQGTHCGSATPSVGHVNTAAGSLKPVSWPFITSTHNLLATRIAAADEPGLQAADEPADPRARRLQRQQRRAARKRSSETEDAAYDATSASTPADAAEGVAEPSSSAKPVSRIAARRAQRSRAVRRVPAALIPDDDIEEHEEDTEEEGSSDDADVAVRDDWDYYGDAADTEATEDADVDAESSSQLPASVLETFQAMRLNQLSRKDSATRQQQQQGTVSQQQQEKQQRSNSGGQGQSNQPRSFDPLELPEANPMYLPVLTDEDLEADPPGHKSGYVAVIGRPNAGKSTLINAIVGQKLSIVTFKPQTTRHRVVGIASAPEYQMILFDTPGIMQEQRSKLDERMMAAVVSSIKAAEVIIAVVDSGDSPQEALAMFQPGPDWSGPPMAVLLNKADLLEEQQIAELESWYKTNCRAEQVFVGSALTANDDAVAAIKAWAVSKLPEGPTLYPKSMVSEQPERFFVSEIIRQHIFLQYEQEIPYSCQVQIAEFKERQGAKDYINALILVERESQAPIVLGAGGKAIKKLGATARAEIEEFLGRKVYLELSVQVAPSWRQQSDKLKDFGYFDPLYIT